MAVEDHPMYAKWRATLVKVIEAKEARDGCRKGTPAYTVAESEYQSALVAYDMVARRI